MITSDFGLYTQPTMFIPLDKNKILSKLRYQQIQLIVEQSVDSTNTYLKNLEIKNQIAICTAEEQTQGRGRLDRRWQSPFGENIYCSFKFYYSNSIAKLSGLGLAISVALHKVLNKYLKNAELKIKWPNDLLFSGKKLAGILIELHNSGSPDAVARMQRSEIRDEAERNPEHVSRHVIVGVGINVNMLTDSENKISQAWTSLKEISKKNIDRNLIISKLINEIIETWEQFMTSGLSPHLAYYHQHDALSSKTIRVENVNQLYEGQSIGINDQGYLRLQLAGGAVIELHSGETKILK